MMIITSVEKELDEVSQVLGDTDAAMILENARTALHVCDSGEESAVAILCASAMICSEIANLSKTIYEASRGE